MFHVGNGKGNRAYEKYHKRNSYFKNTVAKYKNRVDVRIYKDKLTDQEACEIEKSRIKYYKTLGQAKTNFHEGGLGGHTGNYSSVERSKKLSEAMKKKNLNGKNNPMYGKTHTDEVKKMLSKIHKGKTISQKQRDAISQKLKGRKLTKEQIEQRRINATGVVFTEERKRNISNALLKYEYTILYNNTQTTIKGYVHLVKYMKNKYNLSATITEQIVKGTWKCKFKKHAQFKNLQIIKTKIKCID